MIEYRGSSHWHYMVYKLSEDNRWVPVQTFKPYDRDKAILYAKDISSLDDDLLSNDIWGSDL